MHLSLKKPKSTGIGVPREYQISKLKLAQSRGIHLVLGKPVLTGCRTWKNTELVELSCHCQRLGVYTCPRKNSKPTGSVHLEKSPIIKIKLAEPTEVYAPAPVKASLTESLKPVEIPIFSKSKLSLPVSRGMLLTGTE